MARPAVLGAFGRAVRRLRLARGWSQEELADRVGIDRTYIGGIGASVSVIYAAVIILRTLIRGVDIPGYASLLVVVLFIGSISPRICSQRSARTGSWAGATLPMQRTSERS